MNKLHLIEFDEISSLVDKLDFILLSFGYFSLEKISKSPYNQFLNEYRLCVVVRGKCGIFCNNIKYVLSKGDVIIISPLSRYTPETLEEDTDFVCIDFTVKDEKLLMDTLSFKDAIMFNNVVNDRQLNNLYYLNQTLDNKHPGSFVLIKNALESIFIILFKSIREKPELIKQKSTPTTKEKVFLECVEYIDANVSNQIVISEMARFLRYSENYIYKVFKEVLNISCKSFIIDYKLAKALHELKTTRKSINQIALDYGFSNIYYFSNAFKNKYGVSPSSIRKL
ncbi:MAG: helix-turn-helix transcriptional regulator [Erysipelotrichaceae bacterium]